VLNREAGDYENARADLDKTIELAPEDMDAYVERVQTHAAMGNRDLAIQDYETLTGLGLPDNVLAQIQGLIDGMN
jgi:Tfp pilus assembly protein PilF